MRKHYEEPLFLMVKLLGRWAKFNLQSPPKVFLSTEDIFLFKMIKTQKFTMFAFISWY